jgi:hypothetical protein
MAQAGQILGWIGVALCVIGLLLFVALFVFAVGASESISGGAESPIYVD